MSTQLKSVWFELKKEIINSNPSRGKWDADQVKAVLISKAGSLDNYVESYQVSYPSFENDLLRKAGKSAMPWNRAQQIGELVRAKIS